MTGDIENIRRAGSRLIIFGGWLVTAIILGGFTSGEPGGIWIAGTSLALNLPTTICTLRGATGLRSRIATALVAALQPALFTLATAATAWHTEAHLLAYVALVALILQCDHRPIISAAIVIVLIEFAMIFGPHSTHTELATPSLNAGFHIVAIASVAIFLCWITLSYIKAMDRTDDARRKSEDQAGLLQEQADELQKALRRVEIERQAREQAEKDKSEQRKADIARFSSDFESSIAKVIRSVASTANVLDRSTKELERIARDTGDRAASVLDSAESANRMANNVANGVAELSGSITNIAANASQQKEVTQQATQRSIAGGKALESLSDQSETIGEATRLIARIAEKTNLLALNAAIEAATAGSTGRGFTVVAQEVKLLAKQAADAAIEIEHFLNGVRSGTIEADRSFSVVETAVADLAGAAMAIHRDIDEQRNSTDAITEYARDAADEIKSMAARSRSLVDSAENTKSLSSKLNKAADALLEIVRELEDETDQFVERLNAA